MINTLMTVLFADGTHATKWVPPPPTVIIEYHEFQGRTIIGFEFKGPDEERYRLATQECSPDHPLNKPVSETSWQLSVA